MRRALLTVLALAAVACSGNDDSTTGDGDVASADTTETPVTSDVEVADADADIGQDSGEDTGDESGAERFEMTITLPAPPDDLDVPEPIGVPGDPIDPARINAESIWLWCDESEGTPIVTLTVGDVWETGEGAGVVVEINPLSIGGGNDVAMPTLQSDVVVFVVDVHGVEGLPQEYNSVEEESFGAVTVDAVPCVGQGDVLELSIDGGIGAETNPGYIAAASIEGSLRLTLTGPPPF